MKECYICGSYHMVQKHHAVGGHGKRKQHESPESLYYLCWEHHHGTEGVHGKNGRRLAVKLKRETQKKYFDKGMTEDEVRRAMGWVLY